MDDRFNVNGVWYCLLKDGSGDYVGLKYDSVEDNLLKSLLVADDGTVQEYKPWGLKFTITGTGDDM